MVEREVIASAVRTDVEVLEVGNWYVAEGSYKEYEGAMQGESKQEAIDKLISRLYRRAKQDESSYDWTDESSVREEIHNFGTE